MVKQFIPQVEADQATEMLRAMQYPTLSTMYDSNPEALATSQRLWIACQVVDLALDDETNVQLEGEDIHVTLARAIVEKANSVKLPVEIHGRITAIPVGEPFNAISVCVDGKEAYQLTDITTVGEQHGTD
jgi:hypothetical protein